MFANHHGTAHYERPELCSHHWSQSGQSEEAEVLQECGHDITDLIYARQLAYSFCGLPTDDSRKKV